MAFEGAAAAAPPTAGEGGELSSLSGKIRALMQTKSQIDNQSSALGTGSDTTALRSKLLASEGTAQTLQNEVELGLRRARVSMMNSGDAAGQRQVKVLEQQYAKLKEGVAASVASSRLKRRQFAPADSGSGAGGGAAVAGAGGASEGGGAEVALDAARSRAAARRQQNRDGGGDGESGARKNPLVMEFQQFGDVEASIIQERNEEAIKVVQGVTTLGRMQQDISTLVGEQGESIAVIEANVDAAAEKTEAGVAELTVAASYQATARCKCLVFWVLLAIAAALITIPLVIHYVPKQQQTPSPPPPLPE